MYRDPRGQPDAAFLNESDAFLLGKRAERLTALACRRMILSRRPGQEKEDGSRRQADEGSEDDPERRLSPARKGPDMFFCMRRNVLFVRFIHSASFVKKFHATCLNSVYRMKTDHSRSFGFTPGARQVESRPPAILPRRECQRRSASHPQYYPPARYGRAARRRTLRSSLSVSR